MKIVKDISLTVDLAPEELSEIFCGMDDMEQVRFFNQIAEISKGWKNPFEFQMASVSINKNLTEGAKMIMKTIGEYAK